MTNPPKWPRKFLKWYCNPDLLEEIEGDIYELFDRRVDEKGIGFAKRRFAWDVVRFCRWTNIKRTQSINQRSNSTIMLKNYINVGFRNVRRNWLTSSINIFGLALALGCLITLFIFIDMQQNMDKYHKNSANIYQVVNMIKNDNAGAEKWSDSPIQLGPTMVENHPQVADMFRIEFQSANVKYKDQVFHEGLSFVDPGFLNNLDYNVLSGNENSLDIRDHLVISYNTAEKYFADEDPIGKQMTLKFSNGRVKTFTVGAVLEKYRYNTSIRYNFMLPMKNFEDLGLAEKLDWSYLTDATFVVLNDRANPAKLESELSEYVALQNSFDPEWAVESFELISLDELAQKNFEIISSVSGSSHPAGQVALGIVAILLTVLACFNYMNISVASSSKRLKEIALRKVMGSDQRGITMQFLVENFMQVIFALIIGTLISYFLFMPGFNIMLPFTVPFRFTSIPMMALFFLGLLIFVGIISSLYPALYVSKFQPVSIFKGKTRFGSRNLFSKILLGFQLTFAFITVVASFLFSDNALHLKNQEWGYDGEDILSVRVNDPSQFVALREFALENPHVRDMVGTSGNFTQDFDIITVNHLETEVRSVVLGTSPGYPGLMDLKLIDGRVINNQLDDAVNREILINKQFVATMGWEEPLGKKITIDSAKYSVVGIVENFKYQVWFGYEQMLPAIIKVVPEEQYQYAVFKSTAGNLDILDEEVKSKWLAIAPNDPYDRVIQAHAYDEYLNEMDSNVIVISFISLIAIVLASLGLFGLLSFNIQSRLKEFSVRKILGAQVLEIIRVAAKQYIWIVLIGFLIGAPIGYLTMDTMIQNIYPDPKPTSWIPFVLAIVIMFATLSISIIGQLLKAAQVNPAENLRNE